MYTQRTILLIHIYINRYVTQRTRYTGRAMLNTLRGRRSYVITGATTFSVFIVEKLGPIARAGP